MGLFKAASQWLAFQFNSIIRAYREHKTMTNNEVNTSDLLAQLNAITKVVAGLQSQIEAIASQAVENAIVAEPAPVVEPTPVATPSKPSKVEAVVHTSNGNLRIHDFRKLADDNGKIVAYKVTFDNGDKKRTFYLNAGMSPRIQSGKLAVENGFSIAVDQVRGVNSLRKFGAHSDYDASQAYSLANYLGLPVTKTTEPKQCLLAVRQFMLDNWPIISAWTKPEKSNRKSSGTSKPAEWIDV